MYDNKVRLSKDVLDKAEVIASTWGLKNARAAVEAVFRRYADDYLNRQGRAIDSLQPLTIPFSAPQYDSETRGGGCEALDELDDLLGL